MRYSEPEIECEKIPEACHVRGRLLRGKRAQVGQVRVPEKN